MWKLSSYRMVFLLICPWIVSTNEFLKQPHILEELRFVQQTDCIPPPGEEHGRTAPNSQQMLHCPPGSVIHIQSAQFGQKFTSDTPCLFSKSLMDDTNTPQTGGLLPFNDPLIRRACSTRSVTALAQKLCHGLTNCDLSYRLRGLANMTDCPYTTVLEVNFTCLPAHIQTELICADSYVELTCENVDIRSRLLILKATQVFHSPRIPDDIRTVRQLGVCQDLSSACENRQSTEFYAHLCNRRSNCTVTPKQTVDRSQTNYDSNTPQVLVIRPTTKETNQDQPVCGKSHLLLEYTCALDLLLRSLPSSKLKPQREVKLQHVRSKSDPTFLAITGPLYRPSPAPENDRTTDRSQYGVIHQTNIQEKKPETTPAPQGSNPIYIASSIPTVISCILILGVLTYACRTRCPISFRRDQHCQQKSQLGTFPTQPAQTSSTQYDVSQKLSECSDSQHYLIPSWTQHTPNSMCGTAECQKNSYCSHSAHCPLRTTNDQSHGSECIRTSRPSITSDPENRGEHVHLCKHKNSVQIRSTGDDRWTTPGFSEGHESYPFIKLPFTSLYGKELNPSADSPPHPKHICAQSDQSFHFTSASEQAISPTGMARSQQIRKLDCHKDLGSSIQTYSSVTPHISQQSEVRLLPPLFGQVKDDKVDGNHSPASRWKNNVPVVMYPHDYDDSPKQTCSKKPPATLHFNKPDLCPSYDPTSDRSNCSPIYQSEEDRITGRRLDNHHLIDYGTMLCSDKSISPIITGKHHPENIPNTISISYTSDHSRAPTTYGVTFGTQRHVLADSMRRSFRP